MVVVNITDPSGATEPLSLFVEPSDLGRFLVRDGVSEVRKFLIEMLGNGDLNTRDDWDENKILSTFHVEIPELEYQYTVATESHEGECHTEDPCILRKKGHTRWSHVSTLRLIALWAERQSRFSNNVERNEEIWEEVALSLQNEDHFFTASQAENRFKYLKKLYTETVDENKKSTGQPEKSCPYYEQLDELFKKSPLVNPPMLASSRDGLSAFSNSANSLSPSPSTSRYSDINSDTFSTPTHSTSRNLDLPSRSAPLSPSTSSQPPKKKTRLESALGRWTMEFQDQAKEREKARQKRHEEQIQLQRETNEIFKNIMHKILEKM